MIPREIRRQFQVSVLLHSIEDNTEMKGALIEAGYESLVFMDQDSLLESIRQSPPHVVLFSVEALMASLSDFVGDVLKINSEIQFACIGPSAQAAALSEYKEYNFAVLVAPGEGLGVRATWAVDLVCEKLYRTYQNEELVSRLEKIETETRAESVRTREEIERLRAAQSQIREVRLSEKIRTYDGCQSKDDFITAFLKGSELQGVYFKFLPTVTSFVATYAQGLEIERMKGVGSRMSADEARDPKAFLLSGKIPQALHELMQDGLKVSDYFSKLVEVPNGIDGLFVLWGDREAAVHQAAIENNFLVFQLLYQRAHLMKRNEGLDIFDGTTELFNRSQFYKKLDEEIARARRLEKPVSVIRLSIDHLVEIEQSFGRNNRDLILRTIAAIVRKTSRVNDCACRTEENEFSLILPHCGRKGAALRAERLRRMIEAHTFALTEVKVTISCGVSEYPSLSKSAEDLDLSAAKALEFIVGRGGNKVCLFKPTQEFKPDFEVPPS